MNSLIRCPKCHKKFSLDDLVLDETVNKIFSIFLNIKDVITKNLILEYIELFKASDDEDLSYAEVLNILYDLQKIDSFENLHSSLEQTIKSLKFKNTKLINHLYLKKVYESLKSSNLNKVPNKIIRKNTTSLVTNLANSSNTHIAALELEKLANEFQ